MRTTAAIVLVLPTVFFVMMFAYGPLDQGAYLFFGILCLLSAMVCLGCAWFLRHRSRRLAWACAAVGSLYVILLVVVPVLVTMLVPHNTRRSKGAEIIGANAGGPSQLPMKTRQAVRSAQFLS